MTMQRKLAHFEFVRELGRGGMGVVFLAQDTELDRKVAVKVLPPDQFREPDMIRRLEREAKMVAALNHPNIVTIHQVGEEDGAHFLVMEYVEGRTLRDLIPASGMALPDLLEIAVPLAGALEAAHAAGIIHRDLKPGNLMVTQDGRVKVLDFGLAKPSAGCDVNPEAPTQTITQEGAFVGTLAYLSPEQLQGRSPDSRSDIFANGIILQEMASGVRPFVGATTVDVISSILKDTPPPLSDSRPELPEELGEIVAQCLEKNPEHRIQTAEELRLRLQDLESGASTASISRTAVISRAVPSGTKRIGWLLAAVLAATALATGGYFLSRRAGPEVEPTAAAPALLEAGRPTLGVLHFQNLSSDPELEWLRAGLVDLLVTDLSQGARLEILSTDRLYQILKETDHLGENVVSLDAVQAIADRAGVDNVVLGRFARVGETLQISITIQEAATGRILGAGQVQGKDDAALFSMVDDLSRTIRDHFDAESTAPDTDLVQVTTASIDAYRYYLESVNYNMQAEWDKAIASGEKAIELDPGFGLALARLGHVYENLGQTDKAHDYIARALEHGDRLPPAERYFIEGESLARHWSTMKRAVASFRKALELAPDQNSARHSLAVTYGFLERYEESIAEFEELERRGVPRAASYYSHANMLSALGRFEQGEQVVQMFAREAPGNWFGSLSQGWHYMIWNKLDVALSYFDEAESLRPGTDVLHHARWLTSVEAEDWEQAASAADRLVDSTVQVWRWRGFLSRGWLALYRGRPEQALREFERAAAVHRDVGGYAAAARVWAGSAQLLLDQPGAALRLASEGLRQGVGEWSELEALHLISLSQAAKADWDSSSRRADELRGQLDESDHVQVRLGHRLSGDLDLIRGDPNAAIVALAAAERTLPPRGIKWHHQKLPDHVPVWYALGRAYLQAGRLEEAAPWFGRVIESSIEHVEFPVQYVRSYFHLGQIHSTLGESERARKEYRRFLSYWQDGDVDLRQIAEAREYLERQPG